MDYPSGLRNIGAICWLNSLLQSLLTCKHFFDYIRTHKDIHKNNTYKSLVEICESIEKSDDILDKSSYFLKAFISDLKSNKKEIDIGFGYQCSSEGLILILDQINSPKINSLFTHSYEIELVCNESGKSLSKRRANDTIFYIFDEESLQKKGLRDYLLSHESELEKEFIPEDWKNEHQPHYTYKRVAQLKRISEIVVIALNRYMTTGLKSLPRNAAIKLPNTFTIDSNKQIAMHYKKIAEIDHLGSLRGGHYISRCVRDKDVYLLNDSSYKKFQLETLPSTYLTWYELTEETS